MAAVAGARWSGQGELRHAGAVTRARDRAALCGRGHGRIERADVADPANELVEIVSEAIRRQQNQPDEDGCREAGNDDVALFEIARVYLPSGEQLPEERWRLGAVVDGGYARAKTAVDLIYAALKIEEPVERGDHRSAGDVEHRRSMRSGRPNSSDRVSKSARLAAVGRTVGGP